MFKNLKLRKFVGIPDYIDVKQVMQIPIFRYEHENNYNFFVCLKKIIKCTLFENFIYKYNQKDNSKYLFFYGTEFYRDDHQKIITNFSSSFEEADSFIPYRLTKNKFNLYKFPLLVILCCAWFIQLLFRKANIKEILLILPYLLLCYNTLSNVKQLNLMKYRFVVVYYDLAPDENCFIQYLKNKHIVTMTLQHGIFAKKEVVKNISDTAIELANSSSDYYLAWNEYTKDEALKVGMKSEKIKVLGIPRYINDKGTLEPIYSKNNNIFGIMLNCGDFDEHNRKLLTMAEKIGNALNMQYVVRFHPRLKKGAYQELLGNHFKCADDNKSSIKDYAAKVAFTIMSSSSVFADLIYLRHPTYRLVVTSEDTYSSIKDNSFETVEEFLCQYNQNRINSSNNEKLFNYICYTNSIYDSYKAFFDSFFYCKESNK